MDYLFVFHCFSKSVHGVIAADITVQHLMTFLYNTAIRVGHLVDSAWMIMDDTGWVTLRVHSKIRLSGSCRSMWPIGLL